MTNNKPFINYAIKASHNSYLVANYQVSTAIIIKSFFGMRNKPTNDNTALYNHLNELLNNNFKFFEFDITNQNGNVVIQHTTNIQGRNFSVSKSYDFNNIMENFVNNLKKRNVETPIFIY